jgi:hypothetical protein
MKTHVRLPNLQNYTPSRLVDECAPDVEEMNRLKKLTDYLKTGLKARVVGVEEFNSPSGDGYLVKGEKYMAKITEGDQTRLDQEKLREWIDRINVFGDLLIKAGKTTHAELIEWGLVPEPPIYKRIEVTTVNFEKIPSEL